jgi:hypothetical protein
MKLNEGSRRLRARRRTRRGRRRRGAGSGRGSAPASVPAPSAAGRRLRGGERDGRLPSGAPAVHVPLPRWRGEASGQVPGPGRPPRHGSQLSRRAARDPCGPAGRTPPKSREQQGSPARFGCCRSGDSSLRWRYRPGAGVPPREQVDAGGPDGTADRVDDDIEALARIDPHGAGRALRLGDTALCCRFSGPAATGRAGGEFGALTGVARHL